MTREARCSIAIRGVSISTDVPADGRSAIHNDDSRRSAQPPKTKGRSRSRWHGALADERDRHRVEAHAVARDAAGGVGGVEQGGNKLNGSGQVFGSLEFPCGIASVVKMVLVQTVALVEL
jgi:hypothetical protein